jgi:hypothetical protein
VQGSSEKPGRLIDLAEHVGKCSVSHSHKDTRRCEDFCSKIPCRAVLCRVTELVGEFSSSEYMTDAILWRFKQIPESLYQ